MRYRAVFHLSKSLAEFRVRRRDDSFSTVSALPLGELSPQVTERGLQAFCMVIVCPLRPRCARTPLPRGEASRAKSPAFSLDMCVAENTLRGVRVGSSAVSGQQKRRTQRSFVEKVALPLFRQSASSQSSRGRSSCRRASSSAFTAASKPSGSLLRAARRSAP